ncbi:MAG: secD, partial [Myxococcaceae bacterium]|nr:secD [Myxococcaceae bacterium]
MNANIRNRLLIILVLVVASVWALWPRTVTTRERDPKTGVFHDTTRTRVPLKRGLDLQGGMYLALEVDDSKGVVQNKAEAIDRALKVVRTRIEGMGVSETVIQKAGNDRIIVDIPGIDDRERAIKMAQDQAFLQFQIADKTQAFEKVLPRLDAIAKEKGFGTAAAAADAKAGAPGAGLNGLLTNGADSTKAGKKDSTKTDSASIPGVSGGVISKMILAGQSPGEFLFDRNNQDALKTFLESPDVQAALPPGKVVRFGSDSTVIQNKTYRFL